MISFAEKLEARLNALPNDSTFVILGLVIDTKSINTYKYRNDDVIVDLEIPGAPPSSFKTEDLADYNVVFISIIGE